MIFPLLYYSPKISLDIQSRFYTGLIPFFYLNFKNYPLEKSPSHFIPLLYGINPVFLFKL